MNKKEIIAKVKIKLALNSKQKELLNNALKLSQGLTSIKLVSFLKDLSEELDLSDSDFAEVLESLIRNYQLHQRSNEFKKGLKELTTKPPLKIYLQGLIF